MSDSVCGDFLVRFLNNYFFVSGCLGEYLGLRNKMTSDQ
jgi:hypothetical protein